MQAGRVECWSFPDIGFHPEWAGPIGTAARGGTWKDKVCGILADSTITCWDVRTHEQYGAKKKARTGCHDSTDR